MWDATPCVAATEPSNAIPLLIDPLSIWGGPRMLTHLQIAIEMHALTRSKQDRRSAAQGESTKSAQAFSWVQAFFRIHEARLRINSIEFEIAIGSHGCSSQGKSQPFWCTRSLNHNSGEFH